MNEFFRRLAYLFNRNRRHRELKNEMDFHREMAERSGGSEHSDAQSRRRFGNATRLQEQAREAGAGHGSIASCKTFTSPPECWRARLASRSWRP
jgi:hypothetical protein